MKLTPKARRVLEDRRHAHTMWHSRERHIRQVLWFGSEGDRCYGCHHIPMLPWEHPTAEQQNYLQHMLENCDHPECAEMMEIIEQVACRIHARRR